jgi:hypothetical protein
LTVGAAGLLIRDEGIRQLEVIPVHVLDRPHLLHAAAITAACATLAIVLTLLLAGTLNDLTSTSADAEPHPLDIDPCGMESEPVHEPVALPRPGPMDGRLLATPCDADGDRW